jgi:peptide/nickel transport system ATP-binding protein
VSPLVEVKGLSVAYRRGEGWSRVVDDVSFAIAPGEVFGLVGESGCGKSTIALQLLGYRHPSLKVESGAVLFKGQAVTGLPRAGLDKLRGDRIAFVPQNPTTALNPGIRIGAQLAEPVVAHHRGETDAATRARMAETLALVGLPSDARFLRRYPHQLSGGQQQRICIAMALACDPDLLVLDEPTTGLDVTTQEQILYLLNQVRSRIGLAMLYVTHDLALLSQIADRIGVMYAGHMVEYAPTREIFLAPKHPYTQGLIASIPGIAATARPLRGLLRRQELPAGCPFAPRCDHATERCHAEPQTLEPVDAASAVACWRWREIVPERGEAPAAAASHARPGVPVLALKGVDVVYGSGARAFLAVNDVSFDIAEGEVFALVGESGSGKSTLAKAISGLEAPAAGSIALRDAPLRPTVKDRTAEQLRLVQYVFQNPDASLNPRKRVGASIARPLEHFFRADAGAARGKVAAALDDVRLDESYAARFPDQLSGGERQRVAIARALAAQPALLLCDEILSALDVSVQASVLALLRRLKAEHGIAMLFISHDLAVVRLLADRVCVLYGGEVMEIGPTERVFAPPFHPYTYTLLNAVPVPLTAPGVPPQRSTSKPPRRGQPGCVYAGRCPWQLGAICETERPPWQDCGGGVRLRCHIPPDELRQKSAVHPATGIEAQKVLS